MGIPMYPLKKEETDHVFGKNTSNPLIKQRSVKTTIQKYEAHGWNLEV
jgi:hypothetical protein